MSVERNFGYSNPLLSLISRVGLLIYEHRTRLCDLKCMYDTFGSFLFRRSVIKSILPMGRYVPRWIEIKIIRICIYVFLRSNTGLLRDFLRCLCKLLSYRPCTRYYEYDFLLFFLFSSFFPFRYEPCLSSPVGFRGPMFLCALRSPEKDSLFTQQTSFNSMPEC